MTYRECSECGDVVRLGEQCSCSADDVLVPCVLGMSTLGSQVVCVRCGDDCDCYVCVEG